MSFKKITLLILLFLVIFGSVTYVIVQTSSEQQTQESTLEKIKDILTDIRTTLSDTLARVISYALTAATNNSVSVNVDYNTVEYYPNLKSKIGFASNIKEGAPLETAVSMLEPIGPGAICNNIEFDQWLKWKDDDSDSLNKTVSADTNNYDNPALNEELSDPKNPASRPVRTNDNPTSWLNQYEKKIGGGNMSIVFQLTGPAPQFQAADSEYSDLARHPAPTNITVSADYSARLTDASKHAYPILWSLWNEPGHTLMSVDRGRDSTGAAIPGCKLDNAGNVVDLACESQEAYKIRWQQERDKSVLVLSDMYSQYNKALRKTIGTYSRFGGASFLASDFNPAKLSQTDGPLAGGTVYFKEFITAQKKDTNSDINFFSFNSFNGSFDLTMKSARTILGTLPNDSLYERSTLIFTQYAPSLLKMDEDGNPTSDSDKTPIMPVVTEELTDLVSFQNATDVQFVCHSYWVGGKTGVFQQNSSTQNTLVPTARYSALKLFAELPIIRSKLKLAGTSVGPNGIMGLAGINHTTAAVLLWNNSTTDTIKLPIKSINMPTSIAAGVTTLQILDKSSSLPKIVPYKVGDDIKLPPNSVALLKTQISGVKDPLMNRKTLGSASFLETRTFTNRVASACASGDAVPGVANCAYNTGTYGFYDSVRGAAYLGTSPTVGAANPKVLAVYKNIPSTLYVNMNIYNNDLSSASFKQGSVAVTLSFPNCSKQNPVKINTANETLLKRGIGIFDLVAAKVPANCYQNVPTEITFEASGLKLGAQTEIYLSASLAAAEEISKYTNLIRSTSNTTKLSI